MDKSEKGRGLSEKEKVRKREREREIYNNSLTQVKG